MEIHLGSLKEKRGADFMIGVCAPAADARQGLVRHPEVHSRRYGHRRKSKLERLQREKEALRRAEERRLLQLLEDQADYWAKAGRLRAFIRAVEQSGIERVLKGENEIGIQEWLSWARRHADRIDPLVSVANAE